MVSFVDTLLKALLASPERGPDRPVQYRVSYSKRIDDEIRRLVFRFRSLDDWLGRDGVNAVAVGNRKGRWDTQALRAADWQERPARPVG